MFDNTDTRPNPLEAQGDSYRLGGAVTLTRPIFATRFPIGLPNGPVSASIDSDCVLSPGEVRERILAPAFGFEIIQSDVDGRRH